MNTYILYQNKYKKYKNKYLLLKYNLHGGNFKKYLNEIVDYISFDFEKILNKLQVIIYHNYNLDSIDYNKIYNHLNGNEPVSQSAHFFCSNCLKYDENIKIFDISNYLNNKTIKNSEDEKIYIENIVTLLPKSVSETIAEYKKLLIKLNVIIYFTHVIKKLVTLDKISKINVIITELEKIIRNINNNNIEIVDNKTLNEALEQPDIKINIQLKRLNT